PAAASILLSARREGDRVIVEVSDDGAGIDPAAIRRLAASRHVAEEAAIAAMSDDEAVTLIFAPGFSTAEKVTGLSGRGVGMGAVRSAIEQLGGEVQLVNRPGQRLTVRLILPFTIMLTRVMTVHAGGQTFGVPFDAIVETVRVPRDAIRPLGAGRAFVLRNETIPVVDLAHSLGLPPAAETGRASILVVWAGGIRAGLEIDRPGERMDMILKPVEGLLSGMPAVAGASLLGTGEVLIVLDLEALLQ
ncbi:MAG TPA: chemotaxis protein CheW, partial [Hyphomonadaceae bacterium]|nr:chemotaxis protein CheW [Hyphomonadaceae bacterium]